MAEIKINQEILNAVKDVIFNDCEYIKRYGGSNKKILVLFDPNMLVYALNHFDKAEITFITGSKKVSDISIDGIKDIVYISPDNTELFFDTISISKFDTILGDIPNNMLKGLGKSSVVDENIYVVGTYACRDNYEVSLPFSKKIYDYDDNTLLIHYATYNSDSKSEKYIFVGQIKDWKEIITDNCNKIWKDTGLTCKYNVNNNKDIVRLHSYGIMVKKIYDKTNSKSKTINTRLKEFATEKLYPDKEMTAKELISVYKNERKELYNAKVEQQGGESKAFNQLVAEIGSRMIRDMGFKIISDESPHKYCLTEEGKKKYKPKKME
jgi:hypothetical protein